MSIRFLRAASKNESDRGRRESERERERKIERKRESERERQSRRKSERKKERERERERERPPADCSLRCSTLSSHPSGINVVWQWCVRRTWYHGLGICPVINVSM